MIDQLPKSVLEEARESRFYQALIAELMSRQRAALGRMQAYGDGGERADRLYALAGRAACCEDLLRLLERTQGKED